MSIWEIDDEVSPDDPCGILRADRNAEISASAKDFTRSEGVYASVEIYPPPPLVGGIGLIKIERVCGDCTVKELILAPSEAQSLLEQLTSLMSNDAPIPPTLDRSTEPNTPEAK